MDDGNIITIAAIFVAMILVILIFTAAIFMSHINNTLYNFKLDMYSISRSGVLAVNKNKTSIGNFSYDTKSYKKYFEEGLKKNYDLDKNLSNEDRLISKIEIKEYKIYNKGEKDKFTKKRCEDRTLHIVLDVQIKPIIFRKYLEKILTFEIHEDVNLNIVDQ